MNRTFYVAGFNEEVVSMFTKRKWIHTKKEDEAEVIVFTGGADITPFLYGEKCHKTTKPNLLRDLKEIRLFKETPLAKPKIGICRGAQLLNVLSGGSLWQNVNHHTSSHKLYDIRTGDYVLVTSTHHQMMLPNELGEVLAVAGKSTVKEADMLKFSVDPIEEDPDTWEDAEVIWYEHTKSLCFQAHPEYHIKECQQYFFDLLSELIFPNNKRN